MTDLLFQIGLSNACLSLALAIVAMLVGARAKRPHLAYMLWLLVFVKLVTPPIVTIPIGTFSVQPDQVVATNDHDLNLDEQPAIAETAQPSSWLLNMAATASRAKPWLAPIWLLGSVLVFVVSMVRVCRFSRLLAKKSEVAPQELQTAAVEIARRLGLNRIATILTTSANLSPMVWWSGGKVRIVIPTTLLDQMDAQQWQWILAHELAHVRRRDYLVRWLEWLACVLFWWNPVVWWAQRNLRAMEEICCDDLVLSCLNPKPKLYANSLLSAVEFLARPVLRPPAMASEVNSGGVLERRFKMIVSEKTKRSHSRRLQVCVLLCAMLVLPLGIASAQDYEAVGRRLRAAVEAGELTGEQARIMIGALREASAAEEAPASDRAKAYLMRVRKELGAAVEAGTISEDAAKRRYEAAEKGVKERLAAGRGGDSTRISREDYARAEAELRKAVAEGRTSPEDARARLNGMRREMARQAERGERGITVEQYKRAEAKMRKMIEEGKAKPEDVERRLIEMRKMMADQRGDMRARYEGFERRIRAAVEAGEMTPEEAREKLAGYRRRLAMADRDDRAGGDDDLRGRIIRALMDNGIAREQIRGVLGELRLVIGEMRNEGDAFELDPGARERLAGMGLTDEQIDFVVRLAQRLAHRPTD